MIATLPQTSLSFSEAQLKTVTGLTGIENGDSRMIKVLKLTGGPFLKVGVVACAIFEVLARAAALWITGIFQFSMGKGVTEITAPIRSAAATILNALASVTEVYAEQSIPLPLAEVVAKSWYSRLYEAIRDTGSSACSLVYEHKEPLAICVVGAVALFVANRYWQDLLGKGSDSDSVLTKVPDEIPSFTSFWPRDLGRWFNANFGVEGVVPELASGLIIYGLLSSTGAGLLSKSRICTRAQQANDVGGREPDVQEEIAVDEQPVSFGNNLVTEPGSEVQEEIAVDEQPAFSGSDSAKGKDSRMETPVKVGTRRRSNSTETSRSPLKRDNT